MVVIEVPLVGFEATGVHQPVPESSDWVVYTSVNGVLFGGGMAVHGGPVAAVGPATAQALTERGVRVEVMPPVARGAALAAALVERVEGRRVWLPRAERVSPDLEVSLRHMGAEPVGVPVYRNVMPPGASFALEQAGEVDAVAFASGSAARHFLEAGGQGTGPKVAVIGPSTAAVCQELGLKVAAVADPHTAEGLAAVLLALSRRPAG